MIWKAAGIGIAIGAGLWLLKNRGFNGNNSKIDEKTTSSIPVEPNTTFLERSLLGQPSEISAPQGTGIMSTKPSGNAFQNYSNLLSPTWKKFDMNSIPD